jgi:hypothetical protein
MKNDEEYTLSDVQKNLEHVAQTLQRENMSMSALLQCNQSLKLWTVVHNLNSMIKKKKDNGLVEAFWGLCQTYGINLKERDKVEIFVHFLRN